MKPEHDTAQRLVATTVYMRAEQRDEITRLAKQLGQPAAVIIREGIDWAIERSQARLDLLDREGL